MSRFFLYVLLTSSLFLISEVPVFAQGLLWSIPQEEGTFVRYFGDLKQVQERPDSARGPLEMSWQSELTIKALGTEEANYKGKPCQCRWLEFKNTIGHQSATGIDTGPYGVRLYKVLVPEEAIIGKVMDDRNIPVILVPVLKGYKKSGNKPVEPIKEKVLTFYPLLGLFAYYPTLKPAGESEETVSLPQLGEVSARHYTGVETLQSMTSRSVNEGEIWTTSEIPFGWASYKAKVVREQKDRLAPVEAFKKHSEMQITMSAVEKGTGARSELNIADDGTVTVEEPASTTPPTENSDSQPTPSEPSPFDEKPAAAEESTSTEQSPPEEQPTPKEESTPAEGEGTTPEDPTNTEQPTEEPSSQSETSSGN